MNEQMIRKLAKDSGIIFGGMNSAGEVKLSCTTRNLREFCGNMLTYVANEIEGLQLKNPKQDLAMMNEGVVKAFNLVFEMAVDVNPPEDTE